MLGQAAGQHERAHAEPEEAGGVAPSQRRLDRDEEQHEDEREPA
jgi:hypothetical protein